MAIPRLKGPHRLASSEIETLIAYWRLGVYALGSIGPDGSIKVAYVGRAEEGLSEQLKRHIGRYEAFAYAFATSIVDAYDMECRLYHHFKPPDNHAHPARPSSSDWPCPVCREFG